MQAPKLNIDRIEITDVPEPIAKAYALRNAGNKDEALKQALACEKQMPNAGTIKFLLGMLHYDNEQFKEAKNYFNQAVKCDPQNEYYYFYLAKTSGHLKQYDVQKQAWETCVKINPNNELAQIGLARCLINLCDFRDALTILKKLIKQKPKNTEILFLIGKIHLMLSKPLLALPYLKKAADFKPNNIDYLNNYAQALMNFGYFHDALVLLHKIINLEPGNLTTLHNMVACYSVLDDDMHVVHYSNQLLKFDPHNSFVWYAKVMAEHNDDINNGNRDVLVRNLHSAQDEGDKIYYLHALARIAENANNCEEASKYFLEANNLYSRKAKLQIELFNKVKKIFTKQEIMRDIGVPQTDITPVFILGLPRSGKTTIEKVVSVHESIHGAGEKDLELIFDLLSDNTKPVGMVYDWYPQSTIEQLQELRNIYLEKLCKDMPEGSKIVCNTIPSNNIYVGLLAILFSEAKFIYVTRDKLDLGCEIYMRRFARSHFYKSEPDQLAKYYYLYESYMQYWKKLLKGKMISIDYKDIICKTNKTCKKVCKFLGVEEFETQNLDFSNNRIGIYKQKYAKYFPELEKAFKDRQNKTFDYTEQEQKEILLNTLKQEVVDAYHLCRDTLMKRICDKMISLESDNECAHFHLAKLSKEKGEYSQAEQHYEITINKNPKNIVAYDELIECLIKQNKQSAAKAWQDKKNKAAS